MNLDLGQYFRTLTGERSVRAIASQTDLDQSTLNRQLTGRSALTIETVTGICRAYDLDMAKVFVAVGFLTEGEARSFSSSFGLSDYSDRELLLEVIRRTDQDEGSDTLTKPIRDLDVERIHREREAEAGVPYIGKIEPYEIPLDAAADARPRKSDVPGADEHPETDLDD